MAGQALALNEGSEAVLLRGPGKSARIHLSSPPPNIDDHGRFNTKISTKKDPDNPFDERNSRAEMYYMLNHFDQDWNTGNWLTVIQIRGTEK